MAVFVIVHGGWGGAWAWTHREIATAHDLHLLNPERTAASIEDLTTRARVARHRGTRRN